MSHLLIAQKAVRSHIKFLEAEHRKFQEIDKVLESLLITDGKLVNRRPVADTIESGVLKKLIRPAKPTATRQGTPLATEAKRKRLQPDVAKDIGEKIVKAVKAYGSGGAARGDIVKYLDANGYRVGHHYTDPILNRMIGDLLAAGEMMRQGDRSKARYLIKSSSETITETVNTRQSKTF